MGKIHNPVYISWAEEQYSWESPSHRTYLGHHTSTIRGKKQKTDYAAASTCLILSSEITAYITAQAVFSVVYQMTFQSTVSLYIHNIKMLRFMEWGRQGSLGHKAAGKKPIWSIRQGVKEEAQLPDQIKGCSRRMQRRTSHVDKHASSLYATAKANFTESRDVF